MSAPILSFSDPLVFANIGRFLTSIDRRSALLAHGCFESVDMLIEDHHWLVCDNFNLAKAIAHLGKSKPSLRRLDVCFNDYGSIRDKSRFDDIVTTLTSMADDGKEIKMDILADGYLRRLIKAPMEQHDNIKITLSPYANDDMRRQFLRMYKVSLISLHGYYADSDHFTLLQLGDLTTQFETLSVGSYHKAQSSMSDAMTVFCQDTNSMIVQSNYNFGEIVGDDMVFHANEIHDEYGTLDVSKSELHMAAYKKCKRLVKAIFSYPHPTLATDSSLPASVTTVGFDLHCVRDPALVTLAQTLSCRKIKIKIIACTDGYLGNYINGILIFVQIQWLRMKNIGIDVELVNQPTWNIPPLAVLYEQLRETHGIAWYSKFCVE